MSIEDAYKRFLNNQLEKHLLRSTPKAHQFKIDFSHNDYLNLSQHPNLRHAGIAALETFGTSSKASRLVTPYHQDLAYDLEQTIAKDKHTDKSLIFCSGFQTNVSVLSALLDRKVLGQTPLVFSDKLNHASLHQGCALAGVKQIRYRHLDYEHLAWLLEKYDAKKSPSFILTESVFGMDGDKASLERLIKLAKDFNAFLYVDEAHATGLYGPQGYGLSTEYPGEIDLIMGTFSKALGCFGAYVACHKTLHDYLINRCQGLIYTTFMPPVQVAIMQAAWALVPQMQSRVKTLFQMAEMLRANIKEIGLDVGHSQTNIIPIRLKCPKTVMAYQAFLNQASIGIAAIRPPSVLPLESRLRIALNCGHTKEEITELMQSLNACKSPEIA